MQDELIEAIRNPFYWVFVSMLLSFCLVSGSQLGDAVELEFQAYRLQQYEFNGNVYGSKSFKIMYDAVSLDAHTIRRCTIASWRDLAGKDLDPIMSTSVGGLLIVIPADLDTLSANDRKDFAKLEEALLSARTDLAVYVTPSNERTTAILSEVAATTGVTTTATQQLLAVIAANSFQFSTTTNPPTAKLTYQPTNVVGQLLSGDRSAPTIAFVAHYDSHSAFPGHSTGSDSNGSGVVALLELLAILKKFYDKPSTRPPYNLVFVWTAGGKYNFQGARQFVEEWNDQNTDSKLELAICLEALGGDGDLMMHVGKEPTKNSAASRFLNRLRTTQNVEVVAKKINLNQPLAWEHERFNMKRLPAVTISRLPAHDSPQRRSMLDTRKNVNKEHLHSAIRSIAEAILGYVLNFSEGGADADSRVEADQSMLSRDAVDTQRIDFFMTQFASTPRSLADPVATQNVAANLAAAVGNYARVTQSPVPIQEVSVFAGVSDRLLAEKVKPAVFELLIAGGIAAYLWMFYHVICRALPSVEGTIRMMRKSL